MPEAVRPMPISTARVAIDTYRPHRRLPGHSLRRVADPLTSADAGPVTSADAPRSWHAATGALTTTIACSVPVFLVGGLAVQISDDLRFSPAGLGLAVSV